MARKTKEEAQATRAQIIDAARRVFHAEGVNRSSLEKVAKAAGVTRGAVYWHFENKAALFLAVRQTYLCRLIVLSAILDEQRGDRSPLDTVTDYLRALFRELLGDPPLRETLEIIMLRCEYVDEFHKVLEIINEPFAEVLSAFQSLYGEAKNCGELKPGLDARLTALDTLFFTRGIIRSVFMSNHPKLNLPLLNELIDSHMGLRRAVMPETQKAP